MPENGRPLVEVLDPDQAIPAEQQARAAYAFAVEQGLKANVRKLRGMWVDICRDLYRFHQAQLWRDLGHQSFEHWLADPDLELERRWVYDQMAIYEQLVVQRGVDPERLKQLQVSKVREVLPAIRRGLVTLDEGLTDAGELRRSDLELRYRGKASDGVTAGPDTSTIVRTEDEPEWQRCKCCGSLVRVAPGTTTDHE